VVLGEQPKVVGAETGLCRVKRLVQVHVAMGAADVGIDFEVAPHAQRDPHCAECSDRSLDRQLDTGGLKIG